MNKYQEALNHIKNIDDTYYQQLYSDDFEALQKLIDELELAHKAYNCRLHDFEIYKKALDKACERLAIFEKALAYDTSEVADKERWKEELLSDE